MNTGHLDTFALERLPPKETWPDFLLGPPTPAYPDRLNCAAELLQRAIRSERGEATAFVSGHDRVTYSELDYQVNKIANVLVDDLGLVPGNRVLIRSANSIQMAAIWLATLKAGGIAVATMPLLRARELSAIVDSAQVNIALCDYRLLTELSSALHASTTLRPVCFDGSGATEQELEHLLTRKSSRFDAIDTAADDVALIAFTSGTTGRSKATVHCHRDLLVICDTFSAQVLQPTAGDLFVGSPPIGFTFGLGGLVLFPMHAGASALLLESAGPEELISAIREHEATILFTSPTAYRRMLRLDVATALKSLRRCVSAGEALPRNVFEAWREATGIQIIDGIGATEMLHIFISSSDDRIRPGAIGVPVPGYEARVVDGAMRDVPVGEVGRLAVRGPTGCRYLADPDLQREYVVDGWNLTGDSMTKDEDGYFWYQARTDDMIITSGYNVAAPEIEAVLLEHPGVSECAVIGVSDEVRGQSIHAHVVLGRSFTASDAMADELREFVKAKIAVYKCPRSIVFRSDLPRTGTGKVARNSLRVEGLHSSVSTAIES